MKIKVTKFDVAEILTDDETIAAYLAVVMEENDPSALISAINTVARAKGIANLGGESLHKTLAAGEQPRFETIHRIMHAFRLKLVPVPHNAAKRTKKRPQDAKSGARNADHGGADGGAAEVAPPK